MAKVSIVIYPLWGGGLEGFGCVIIKIYLIPP